MNNATAPFQWQGDIWQSFTHQLTQQRLAHALLLSGQKGLGKRALALAMAKALLCQDFKLNSPCGHCKGCHLNQAGTHPDVFFLETENKQSVITVDQVRQLIPFAQHSAFLGPFKVVIISHAHRLNLAASNALLKTLEEPVGQLVFILTSESPFELSATILSRCQKIQVPVPTLEQATLWFEQSGYDAQELTDLPVALGLAQGAPLDAQNWLKEENWSFRRRILDSLFKFSAATSTPYEIATLWAKEDPIKALYLFLSVVVDLATLQCSAKENRVVNTDHYSSLTGLKDRLAFVKVMNFYRTLQTAYRTLTHEAGLNKALYLEHLFIEWRQLVQMR